MLGDLQIIAPGTIAYNAETVFIKPKKLEIYFFHQQSTMMKLTGQGKRLPQDLDQQRAGAVQGYWPAPPEAGEA